MTDEKSSKKGTAEQSTPLREWWSKLDWFESDSIGKRWRHHLWIALAGCVLLLPLLGSFGLWDPWETHYGEVGRQITAQNEWISLWWGSHWEGGGGQTEGSYFFSKPVLLMWMMALGMETFGINPWGVRIGVALTAVVGLVTVYSFGASVFRRRTGVVMATVLATTPFWAMLSRQAQTDMPFVGTMTVGMCFFMMAVFGRDRDERAGRFSQLLCASWIAVLSIPQISMLLMGLVTWRGPELAWMERMTETSPMTIVIAWGVLLIGAAVVALVSLVARLRHRRFMAVAALAVVWAVSLAMLIAILASTEHYLEALNGWFIWGPTQATLYATCAGVALYLMFDRPKLTRRRLYLLTFYAFIALATLAKGLLGFMLPGAVLFLYLLITREWHLMKRVELLRGTLIFIAIAVPWYAAMLIRHHPGFWNRFFVHDHFQRLTSGVHALSDGSFEHFIRWLGYGLFPWSALIPAALVRAFSTPTRAFDDDRGRAVLMLVLWAAVGFTLFALSSTTFHHYIFPVVPALAILVGLALDDLIETQEGQPWPLYALGAVAMVVIAWDLIADPQQLKNLFTYRYDRSWDHEAWDGGFRLGLVLIAIPVSAGAALLAIVKRRKLRRWALGLLCGGAFAMTLFSLNIYMPTISPTMSQHQLWERYYELCDEIDAPPGADPRKTFCEQPAIAFKLNWRGETYHTHNQVIPIRSDEDWEVFVDDNGEETFYGIMQHSRYHGEFQRELPDHFRERSCIVHDENLKFVLAKVPAEDDDPECVSEE